MGEVWLGRHDMLERPAAIKIIRPDVLSDDPEGTEALLSRFKREAQGLSALKSPHTIDLYDFGHTAEGGFYLAMELLDGVDLKTFVDRFGPMSPTRVVHVLKQVCESLAEAHSGGLIHRDVKPANIFICRAGLKVDVVKVLDFGLVKRMDNSETQLTAIGAAAGSPAFMPPEIALGRDVVDARADIYAVGCVAYWLLTGALVFEGDTPYDVVLSHVQTEPAAPSSRTELDVPEAIEALVMACLAKAPEDRPQSAAELFTRLEALGGEAWSHGHAVEWWSAHLPDSTVPSPAEQQALAVPSDPKALSDARTRAVAELEQHFADSRINMSQLEARLERVHGADAVALVEAQVADLVAPAVDGAIAVAPQPDLPATTDEPATIVTAFGGFERRGRWSPAPTTNVTCVFGGGELDLRNAVLPTGDLVFNMRCVFGGANVIVPPDLPVHVEGHGFFGAFHDDTGGDADPREDGRRLVIRGFALFGGVKVQVKRQKRKRLARGDSDEPKKRKKKSKR